MTHRNRTVLDLLGRLAPVTLLALAACGAEPPEDGAVGVGAAAFRSPPQRITAPLTPAAGLTFGGGPLALSPDGSRLAVGVPGATFAGHKGAGVVLLFDAASGAPQAIINPAPADDAEFGAALAFHDGGLAVGAPGADRGFGAVYLLRTSSPFFRSLIENPNRGAPVAPPFNNDRFGSALASVGRRLIIGAPFTDCPAANADGGAIYVADTGCASPVAAQRLSSPFCPGGFSWFGASLSRGGAGRLYVGATVDGTVAKHGSVYVLDETTLAVRRKIENPEPGAYDYFGAVTLEHDGALYVSAPTDDLGGVAGQDHGRVFVYDAATGAPRGERRDPAPGAYDHFGSALAVADGKVAVGSSAWLKVGAVALFDAAGAAAGALPNPAGVTTFFGQSLAARGAALFVGAPLETVDGVERAGAVYRC